MTTGTTQLGASTVTFFSAIPAGMVALCPQPGEWLLLYWRGAATPIAAALAACPGADRAWVQRGQQWLAFAVGVPSGVSDDFTLVSNEAVFLHGAGGGRAAPAPAGLTGRMAVVVRVVDGDTLDVQFPDARIQRVRLLGIDAPESVAPGQPVECFGPEAAARLHELVQGKMVRLETDASQDTYDRYGRLLAYVFVDSLLVNEVLVREGYAHEYTFRTPYTYQMIFRAAERDAIAHSRGMWARCR